MWFFFCLLGWGMGGGPASIWCWGYVEGVLLMAGLQPHLALVRLIGLWLGGAAHLGCMSNHGTPG